MTRADDINDEQKRLQTELDEIQSNCKHKEQKIQWHGTQEGFRWTCTECRARLGYPSSTDMIQHLA